MNCIHVWEPKTKQTTNTGDTVTEVFCSKCLLISALPPDDGTAIADEFQRQDAKLKAEIAEAEPAEVTATETVVINP